MKQPSFLSRKTLGQPRYLLAAMAAAFLAALAPVGAWRALESARNRPDEWLHPSASSVQDLSWFREQFGAEQTVLVSWDGCTLKNAESLGRVARKLSAPAGGPRLIADATTGPEVLRELTEPPISLPQREAINRLEGVLIGPPMEHGRQRQARATCLAASLSPEALRSEASLRAAVAELREAVASESTIDAASIRMVGAPLEGLAIDDESRGTLLRWAVVGGALSFAACWARLRSPAIALVVVATGLIAGALCLAIVFYWGIAEVTALGLKAPYLGVADAGLVGLSTANYLLTVAAALRLVHYFEQARREFGLEGAAERAAGMAWKPAAATVFIMAIALGLLWMSDLTPVQRFGAFAAISLALGTVLAYLIVPAALLRFPPRDEDAGEDTAARQGQSGWMQRVAGFSQGGYAMPIACGVLLLAAGVVGMTRLQPSIQLPPLLKANSRLMQDYAWFETNIGNASSLEVVLTIPHERMRAEGEPAEADGQQYRLTPPERARLLDMVAERIANVPEISGVVSAATFAPAGDAGGNTSALAAEFVRAEHEPGTKEATGRDLYRLSVKTPAINVSRGEAEYAKVVGEVRSAVDSMLLAVEQRDWLVRRLHERGDELAGAKVGILYRGAADSTAPAEGSAERLLGELLRENGTAVDGVAYFNAAALEKGGLAEGAREQALGRLREFDVVAQVAAGGDELVSTLASAGVHVADVSDVPQVDESAALVQYETGGPRPIRAAMTGLGAVVHAAEQQFTADLYEVAPLLAAAVSLAVMFAVWNPAAGAAAVVSALLPLAATLGAMGWLGIGIDMGVLIAGTIALGVGLEGTLQFAARYRHAVQAGVDRGESLALAVESCAPGTVSIAIVGGLSLSALALSGVASIAQLGLIAVPMMAVAVLGNAVVLPALVASPLGQFFASPPEVEITTTAVEPKVAAAAPIPAPHSRPQRGVAADVRHDSADEPHAKLHARLQKLRGTPRDSASS